MTELLDRPLDRGGSLDLTNFLSLSLSFLFYFLFFYFAFAVT